MSTRSEIQTSSYVVLIGDVVESRELPDRAQAQERLRAAIDTYNDRHGSALAAPLKLTGGDEMKTILQDPAAAVDVIGPLSEELHPISLAWGMGRGPIETAWTEDVGALDGPCFHRARRAVEGASQAGVWAQARGFSEVDDQVLSALLRLIGRMRDAWTETQRKYIRSVRDRNQRETAHAFGVTEGAVSGSLRRARFHDIEAGEAALRRLLAAYRPAEPGPRTFPEESREQP